MPLHKHFFHLTILFLLLINASHGSKVQNTTSKLESDNELKQWVLFDGQNATASDYEKNKAMTAATSRYISVDPKVGQFKTIQAAIDSLPMENRVRVVINVHAGIYTEKVTIPPSKWYITIQGAGADRTVVQWGDHGLFSATFAVSGPFFIAKNITFKNTATVAPPGAKDMTSVALQISGDAAAFLGCKFYGGQDTLLDDNGRHYFKDCYIEGTVDFICGNGRSLYENCELHSIAPGGGIAAHHRDYENQSTGFTFRGCKVTGSSPVVLGRAWGAYSRTVFAFTYMDRIVKPEGWEDWGDASRHTTRKVIFYNINLTTRL